jgi:hypothetical protein
MSDLDYAIDILKDDLSEICEMQYSPKYATDEITFKKRRQSIELAIEKLTKANDLKTSESGLHIADVSNNEVTVCPNCGCGKPQKTYDGYWCKLCKTEI